MTKVLETTNYKQFKVIKGNRNLNKRYLSMLAEAIKEDNLLSANPIMVNQEMRVLDGQHRLKVAEMIGSPIYYITVPTGGLREVQMLNTNIRRWTTQDFLESYIAIGKKDYQELKDFAESYNVSYAIAMVLLKGGFSQPSSRGQVIEDFRNGDFKVTHREYAVSFMKKLGDIARYTEEEAWKDREFIRALERVYRTFKHSELMERFEISNTRIKRHANSKGYIREFEDVLSFKKKKIRRVD